MQQQRQSTETRTRIFTASEVAEYEYCPLTWWHEQFEPLAHADTEELFARLVELEHEHGSQAPALPEYRMVEQLLLRRGAFDEGREQHREHAEAVAEVEEEVRGTVRATGRARVIAIAAIVLVLLAIALIIAAIILH